MIDTFSMSNLLDSEGGTTWDSSIPYEPCEPVIEIKPSGKELVLFPEPIQATYHSFNDDVKLKTLPKDLLYKSLEGDVDLGIRQAEDCHSDLIPGMYEGGLKIWECTFDLGRYLISFNRDNTLEKKNVLDLGCGAGLIGILASKLGAEHVDLQDFNSGVIKHLTIPNVLLNFSFLPKMRFWYGDWGGFKTTISYDVILTSETIYNPQTYSKLHTLFKNSLKPDGVIFLAAKSYYFGVGGSLAEFLRFVEKEEVFIYKPIWFSDMGVTRKIIELRFKSDETTEEHDLSFALPGIRHQRSFICWA